GEIDITCSKAVLEHVHELRDFARENYRVLSCGGLAIHYFPSKYSLIENHVGIPFGAVFVDKLYYKICCKLGLCFRKFKHSTGYLDAIEFVTNHTKYRSATEIVKIFQDAGFSYCGNYSNLILEER